MACGWHADQDMRGPKSANAIPLAPGRRTHRPALHPTRPALAQRLHRVVQQPRPRRMPRHQHVLVTGSGARGDQRLEGGLQPPPTAQRPRLPGPSGLRCSLQPPMNDRCLDPHTVARFVGRVFVSNVGGSWPYGWNRSAVSCGTYVTCSGRAWPFRTAGGRWAGRPGSLPPSGWTAIPPLRALCPGRCQGTVACPGRRPRGRRAG
jgi:hypothetical protein